MAGFEEACKQLDYHPFIISKIERATALKYFDEILDYYYDTEFRLATPAEKKTIISRRDKILCLNEISKLEREFAIGIYYASIEEDEKDHRKKR